MIFYILVGILAGAASGMGLGGGTILIPALTIIYTLPQQQAQTINLLYFIPTAIVALLTHFKNGNVEKKLVSKIVIFGLIGASAGSVIALNIEPDKLKVFFGYFLLLMGIYEIFGKAPKTKSEVKSMDSVEFEKMKEDFINGDTDRKVQLYISTPGLSPVQYKELLKLFPFNELHRLEEAMA